MTRPETPVGGSRGSAGGGTRDDAVVAQAIAHALRDGARLRYATLQACGAEIARAARLVVDALQRGNKVLVFGNGGSAADAQHIAAELVGRFVIERAPLPGIALTVDTSALTAIANDYGFEQVFARQVRGLGAPGDVAIAITTSGKSPNVLAAIEAAREKSMHVIGLTGAKGKAFPDVCDACVVVPSTNTARIQEIHITVGHLLCEAVDALLHAKGEASGEAPDPSSSGKVVDLDTLVALRERWRSEGRTVVWTNGVFDVLHAGHLSSLRAARAEGDVLVVGVNADEAVRAAKGPSRPVYPVAERAEMLAALEVVDHVVVFAEPTPIEALSRLKPDVHCKGADYAPPNGAPMPEADLVRGYGGRIAFLPLVPERSTTATVARLRESTPDGE
ncbi:MAG: SIS domain-containing protein [Labilithrix sp.]|nr:SIS domain-containing protein [Labilithrix sp.]MCW5835408.1 SIS domain-containing protein [Labilithrix sp.]